MRRAVIILFAIWVLAVFVTDVKAHESTYVIQPGDTLLAIATAHHVRLEELATLNNIVDVDLIYAGQALRLPVHAAHDRANTHIVKSGETLSAIANAYDVDITLLQEYNRILDPDFVLAGQILILPPRLETFPLPLPKRIVVDLSEQRVYAYLGQDLVHQFVVSTGKPGAETTPGNYTIQNKLLVAHAYTWDLEMPYWMGIYWTGRLQNGFHALPLLADGSRLWEGLLGTPVSFGCIILDTPDAYVLFEWAEVGTDVIIQQ